MDTAVRLRWPRHWSAATLLKVNRTMVKRSTSTSWLTYVADTPISSAGCRAVTRISGIQLASGRPSSTTGYTILSNPRGGGSGFIRRGD